MNWFHVALSAIGGGAVTAAAVRYVPWLRGKLTPKDGPPPVIPK